MTRGEKTRDQDAVDATLEDLCQRRAGFVALEVRAAHERIQDLVGEGVHERRFAAKGADIATR